jgi:hypothetical protein
MNDSFIASSNVFCFFLGFLLLPYLLFLLLVAFGLQQMCAISQGLPFLNTISSFLWCQCDMGSSLPLLVA